MVCKSGICGSSQVGRLKSLLTPDFEVGSLFRKLFSWSLVIGVWSFIYLWFPFASCICIFSSLQSRLYRPSSVTGYCTFFPTLWKDHLTTHWLLQVGKQHHYWNVFLTKSPIHSIKNSPGFVDNGNISNLLSWLYICASKWFGSWAQALWLK